jgi:hypothetical protein
MKMDNTIAITITIIIMILVLSSIFLIPYGNATQYDVINPFGNYIDNNNHYHFKGLLDTSNCGTLFQHILWVQPWDFDVPLDIWHKSLSARIMRVKYTCKNGQFTNWEFS